MWNGIRLACLMLLCASSAHARGFTLVGGTKAVQQSRASATSDVYLGYSAGALVDFRLFSKTDVVTGAIYQHQQIGFDNLTDSLSDVKVPLSLRFWMGPISLSLGGYGAAGLGKVSRETGGNKSSLTFTEADTRKAEFGAQGALGFRIGLGSNKALLFDAEFARSLTQVSAGATDASNNSVQLLVGLRFGGHPRK